MITYKGKMLECCVIGCQENAKYEQYDENCLEAFYVCDKHVNEFRHKSSCTLIDNLDLDPDFNKKN